MKTGKKKLQIGLLLALVIMMFMGLTVLAGEIRYNGRQLEGNELSIYKDLANAYETGQFMPGNDSIDVTGSPEEAVKAFWCFWYDYPEIYWVSHLSYSYGYMSDSVSLYLISYYDSVADDIPQVDHQIDKLVNQFSAYDTRLDKIRAIHDYIIMNCEYGDNIAAGQCLITGLLKKYGKCFVCAGYTRLFQLLCVKLNIPCLYVDGNWSEQGKCFPHGWNYVQSDDGKWYLLDVTFDHQHQIKNGVEVPWIIYDFYMIGSEDDPSNDIGHIPDDTFMGSLSLKRTYPALAKKTLHFWDNGEITTAATCTARGEKTYTCTLCGKTKTEKLPKLVPELHLGKTSVKIPKTKTVSLKVSFAKGDKVSAASSDKKIAKAVYSSGKIKITAGKKAGTTSITVNTKTGKKAVVKVTVPKAKTSKLICKAISMKVGGTKKLRPVVTPSYSDDKLTFRSADKSIAPVSSKGVVRAKKKGTTYITIKSGRKRVKVKVTVK